MYIKKQLTKVRDGKPQKPGETGSTSSILSSCAAFILTKYNKVTIKSHKVLQQRFTQMSLLITRTRGFKAYSEEIYKTFTRPFWHLE
jgi:hypothetical protein